MVIIFTGNIEMQKPYQQQYPKLLTDIVLNFDELTISLVKQLKKTKENFDPEATYGVEQNCIENAAILKQFSDNEKIKFAGEVKLDNRFLGSKKSQLFIMSSHLFELTEKKVVTRKIPLNKIKALTYSEKDSKELIIHIQKDVDLYLRHKQISGFFLAIQHSYFSVFGKNIPVYKINGSIQKFALTQKDIDHNRSVELLEKFRDENQ